MIIKKVYSACDEALCSKLSNELNLDKKVCELLLSRGFDSKEKIQKFLNPSKKDFIDPFLLSGMQDCVIKIKEACKKRKRILIFGDYDVDGICATVIMIKAIRALGYNCNFFLPNRFVDGYGLTKESIDKVKAKYDPDIIITVDCGISCHDEVEYAKSKNIEMIITDHHEIPEVLPETITVNAKLPNQKYAFNGLCGAGLAYKIACALLGDKVTDEMLAVATIATIADIVPLLDENRAIVSFGLKVLESLPVGVLAMLKENKINPKTCTASDIAFKIAPKLNSSGRMGEAADSLFLFLEDNQAKIKQQLSRINMHNTKRQELCNSIYDDCIAILKTKNMSEIKCIILSSEKWDSGILGIICARLVDLYHRPVFLFSQIGDELKGSGRSIDNINIHDVLTKVSGCIEKFGGHSMAAGLTLKVSEFDAFVNGVNDYIAKNINDKIFDNVVYYDLKMSAEDFTNKFCDDLALCEPFGCNNSKPIFSTDIELINIAPMKNYPMHANIKINKKFSIVFFNYAPHLAGISYAKNPSIMYEFQGYNKTKNEVLGNGKECYNSGELVLLAKDICDANILYQLAYLNEKNSIKYTYYKPQELASFLLSTKTSMFGTLFIANSLETYTKFISSCDMSGIAEKFLFNVRLSIGSNAILLAPENLDNIANYKRIVMLDGVIDKSFIAKINSICDATVYIPLAKPFDKKLFSDISTNRAELGEVFGALKIVDGKTFENIFKCYTFIKRQFKFNVKYSMFLFAILVMQELGVLGITKLENNNIKFMLTNQKSELSKSSIYNMVDFIKKIK